MAAHVYSPEHSFVRFDQEPEPIGSPQTEFAFPMIDDDDVAFQFIIETDTEQEANQLCDIGHTKIHVGITQQAGNVFDLDYFTAPYNMKPERYRIAPNRVLYNWEFGAPDFSDVIGPEKCFRFMVRVELSTGISYHKTTSRFMRIAADEYTSVLEYGSPKNAFGFVYCGYYEDDPTGNDSETCIDYVQPFSNQSVLVIPYTQAMRDQYGDAPTVDVYIYDSTTGKFQKTIVSIGLDAVPPTVITVDLGGPASGFIKIS